MSIANFIAKNKKLVIISGASLVFLIIIGAIIFLKLINIAELNTPENTNILGRGLPVPEFLTAAEKDSFGLPADSKVQSLKRNSEGKILVYKIIRLDSDIVLDPAAIKPISPRQESVIR